MNKTLTVRRALLIFTPILLVACFLTSQLCYRFMYVPARSKYQQMAAEITEQMTEKDALLVELKRVKGLFDGKYVGSLKEGEILDAVLEAYVRATGDGYAEYYDAEEYKALLQSYEGQGEGIGVRISEDASGRLIVVYAEKEAPAYKAGVRAGDEIVAVEGKRVTEIGADAASNMLIGKKDTEAVFTVKNAQGEREVSVTRKEVNYSTVLYSLEEGKIGYLRILSFASTTYKEFKAAVDDLEKQGAVALVFDLRQNGGGLLSSVHDVLDYLIADGTKEEPKVVVTTKDKNENEQRYICDDGHSVTLPMAVLTDGRTASAAELFAAALRDYELAILVGQTTYGKGVAQSTYELGDGTAVRLTTAKYFPPCGENYDGQGVKPHIEASSEGLNSYLTARGEDPVYLAALEGLKSNK